MAQPVLNIRKVTKLYRGVLGALAVLCLCAAPGLSQEASEYEVKAAFLINFARFVDWPAPTDGGRNQPLSICILGGDPFGDALDRLAQGEEVNSRPIRIRTVGHWDESCQVLFVTRSERNLFRVLRQVDAGVLTVGEDPAFLREGGMITFVVDNRRVRFDVNLKAAESASVRISSRLLTVARTVLR